MPSPHDQALHPVTAPGRGTICYVPTTRRCTLSRRLVGARRVVPHDRALHPVTAPGRGTTCRPPTTRRCTPSRRPVGARRAVPSRPGAAHHHRARSGHDVPSPLRPAVDLAEGHSARSRHGVPSPTIGHCTPSRRPVGARRTVPSRPGAAPRHRTRSRHGVPSAHDWAECCSMHLTGTSGAAILA